MDMDIYDIIDNIYKLPLASKEALLNETPEVTYPKGFHLFLANRKSSKFYLMKKGMLHAYTYKSDKKVTFWFGKEGDGEAEGKAWGCDLTYDYVKINGDYRT